MHPVIWISCKSAYMLFFLVLLWRTLFNLKNIQRNLSLWRILFNLKIIQSNIIEFTDTSTNNPKPNHFRLVYHKSLSINKLTLIATKRYSSIRNRFKYCDKLQLLDSNLRLPGQLGYKNYSKLTHKIASTLTVLLLPQHTVHT